MTAMRIVYFSDVHIEIRESQPAAPWSDILPLGPTLVVTHHVPHSAARHPGHGLNELAPAFCSDCDDLVEAASAAGVAAWIFGHHHWSLAMEMHGVRLLSAQPGYPGEDTGWTGPGYLEI